MIFEIVFVLILLIFLSALISSVKIIKPYEKGIVIRLGKFTGILDSGFNIVAPYITQVRKVDLRTYPIDIERQDVITKDNAPVVVDAVIYIRVTDPVKSEFEVSNYITATMYLAQTTLRSIVGNMELDEVLYNRAKINSTVQTVLDEETDKWGVKAESVEIREVMPAAEVKMSMERQSAAERERRAMILSADGKRRSAILEAEGEKRAMILKAEGVKQKKILESEGEAKAFAIRSAGAETLGHKALTTLSLDTLGKLGEGASTKFVIPFPIDALVRGAAAKYLGVIEKPDESKITLQDIRNGMDEIEKIILESGVTREVEEAERAARDEAKRSVDEIPPEIESTKELKEDTSGGSSKDLLDEMFRKDGE